MWYYVNVSRSAGIAQKVKYIDFQDYVRARAAKECQREIKVPAIENWMVYHYQQLEEGEQTTDLDHSMLL